MYGMAFGFRKCSKQYPKYTGLIYKEPLTFVLGHYSGEKDGLRIFSTGVNPK